MDRTVFDADPEAYDALLLPGGFVSPDLLRQNAHALEFVREFEIPESYIAEESARQLAEIERRRSCVAG